MTAENDPIDVTLQRSKCAGKFILSRGAKMDLVSVFRDPIAAYTVPHYSASAKKFASR